MYEEHMGRGAALSVYVTKYAWRLVDTTYVYAKHVLWHMFRFEQLGPDGLHEEVILDTPP